MAPALIESNSGTVFREKTYGDGNPSVSNGINKSNGAVPNGTGKEDQGRTMLENLLLRDEDIFQTSLNSEDYLESLAPIIKDSLRSNGLSQLITKLNEIVQDKDEELNTLSLNSTRDIDTSIDGIDSIHIESDDLNKALLRINSSLNKSVFELILKKKLLIKFKEVSSKIGETNNTLNLCLQVLEITNKSHELIKQNKYFSALKLIDELTGLHLPKVKDFSFAMKIYDSIPLLRKMIQDESFENLGKWLSINLERKLLAIGEGGFEGIYVLQDDWERRRSESGTTGSNLVFLPYKVNLPIEIASRDPKFNYDIFEDESLQISLTILYDVILVYQTLNEEELLIKLYNKEWMKKYNRIIYPITSTTAAHNTSKSNNNNNLPTFTIASLEEYLKKIAAFFIMDIQINRTTKYQLRTETSSHDLWESYSVKLKPVLFNHLQLTRSNPNFHIDDIIIFKDLIGNFMQVMENSGYKITDLYDVLMVTFREYYAPELIDQFRLEFLESIQSDHYMPLIVQDRQDYDNVMKICWYKAGSPFAPNFVKLMPISFPFSEDYVHYCLGIRSLLEDIITFISKYYGYELNQLNEIILNDIFEKVLGEVKGKGIGLDLKDFISRNENNKEIISQSYTNLEYYLYSLYELGKLLNRRLRQHTGVGVGLQSLTNAQPQNQQQIQAAGVEQGGPVLKAVATFTAIRKFAENTIFKMVDSKIRELLDMVEYDDWMPQHRNLEPNYSIKDFALFLDNLFTSIFHSLPLSFRTLGLFRSYDFVAEHFLNILKDVPRYNRTAIENFDLDINHLEESMSKLYSEELEMPEDLGADESAGGAVALQSTFTELRQCIDLLLLENYDDFIKNLTNRMRKFDRVKYEDGVQLISKIYPPPNINGASGNGVGGEAGGIGGSLDGLDQNLAGSNAGLADSGNASPARHGLPGPLLMSSSTAQKFAKFSSKFRPQNQ